MPSLISMHIKKDKLKELLDRCDEKGMVLTISVQDDSNQYGQNVGMYIEQTKEQREAKTPREYYGNGKVFWTNGTIKKSVKTEKESTAPAEESFAQGDDDLPF